MMQIDAQVIAAALAGEATERELRRLAEWRSADPDNERRYQRLLQVWQAAGEPAVRDPDDARPPAADIVASAEARSRRGSTADVAAAGSGGKDAPKRWFGWKGFAAAAVLVVGIGVGFLLARSQGSDRFGPTQLVTGPGEVATVTLQDGTVVRLAPESRLRFPQRRTGREVSLEGRAYFAVADQVEGPFRVHTPGSEVEVLGTRFDLKTGNGDVQVAVVEGTVKMSAQGRTVTVNASEIARTTQLGVPTVQRVEDVFQSMTWLGPFLAFESTPLRDVAAEFDRRFGIHVLVTDSVLANRTVTGWFADQSPKEMLANICMAVDASCSSRGDTVRVQVSSRQAVRSGAIASK